ncbi:MAG: hypothetical protein RLZZ299_2497 [Pseudomonadota bacterium]|jgi:glycogen debranching enzyme
MSGPPSSGGSPPAPPEPTSAPSVPAPPAPPPDEGTPLELPHATTSGRLVLSRGNAFCVTTQRGDISPAGARELGVFLEDTRYLSHWELELPVPPTLLSAGTEGCLASQVDLTTLDVEHDGFLDEPVQYLHVARRQVLDEEFVEHLLFTNHLGRPAALEARIRFAADWADVFEVRGARRPARGRILPPVVSGHTAGLRYRGRDGETYVTDVAFHPPPDQLTCEGGAGVATFRLRLPPGGQATLLARVHMGRREAAAEGPALRPGFEVRLARARCEAEAWRSGCVTVRADNALVERALHGALADVHALRVDHPVGPVVGAGIPWFAAPFGRDAILSGLQLLPFAPGLAVDTLRFLAAFQGTRHDPTREEEPGRILHELRRGEMVRTGEIPHAPYYGTIDATPLFVILAGETWAWTRDRALADTLWPAVVAALGWLDTRTAGGTRFLAYQRMTALGLENQGWKDSRDGVSHPDGTHARTPIALVEVQGYAAAAWRAGAALARARGDTERAATWEGRVAPFLERLDAAFWMPRTGFHALALDGEGSRVATVASNAGHLLWAQAVPPARAERLARVLLGPDLYSGWGIRTVAAGQPVHNPLSYHNGSVWPHDAALIALGLARYGHRRDALRVAEGLLAATEHFAHHRLPELFCGLDRTAGGLVVHYPVSCSPQAWASGALFMLLQACLGLSADAAGGEDGVGVLRIVDPMLPAPLRRLDLLGVAVGGTRVGLRFTRQGVRTYAEVLEMHGDPLRVRIEVGG